MTNRQIIDTLTQEVTQAKDEAESLCMAIYNQHYRQESPDFELCDSVAGVISQISNMAAGLLESNTTLTQEVERLNEYINRMTASVIEESKVRQKAEQQVKTLRYALIQLLGYARWVQKYCGVSMGMTNVGAIDSAKQAIKDTEVE